MTSVRVEHDGHVAHLILAAPARRNALTPAMAAELVALCEELDADESVGAVVVRGEGGSFCSGADRAVLAAVAADVMNPQAIADLRLIYSAFVRIGHLEAPTIAAIHGAAVGAGLNLAAATDLRIIAESARLIAGFQRIGVHPGGGHFALLGRALGYPATVALTVFGQEIDGRRAAEIGFAWAAVADRSRGPDPRAPLPLRTCSFPNRPRSHFTSARSRWLASFTRSPTSAISRAAA